MRGPRAPCASTSGKRRRLRETPVTPITQYSASRTRNPAVAPRSGRPQFRASMRRASSSRCSPTGDDSPTPPRGERAGRRHSAGVSSLLPPETPPLIPERTGLLSPLDPPATVRCARRPAGRRNRNRDCHDRQDARAECPLWPAMHPAIGALHANGVEVPARQLCDVGHTCACPDATAGRPAVPGSSPATAGSVPGLGLLCWPGRVASTEPPRISTKAPSIAGVSRSPRTETPMAAATSRDCGR